MIQRDEIWKAIEPLVRRLVRSTATSMPNLGGGGNGVLLNHLGTITVYDADVTGLTAALAAAASGDQVWIPGGTYADNFTVPAGVSVMGATRNGTVITGKVTLGGAASIESLSVIRTASSSSTLTGVEGPSVTYPPEMPQEEREIYGKGLVINCLIWVDNAGTGMAIGVRVANSGSVEVIDSELNGISHGGVGYGGGIDGGAGNLYHYGGKCTGSTTPYLEGA